MLIKNEHFDFVAMYMKTNSKSFTIVRYNLRHTVHQIIKSMLLSRNSCNLVVFRSLTRCPMVSSTLLPFTKGMFMLSINVTLLRDCSYVNLYLCTQQKCRKHFSFTSFQTQKCCKYGTVTIRIGKLHTILMDINIIFQI